MPDITLMDEFDLLLEEYRHECCQESVCPTEFRKKAEKRMKDFVKKLIENHEPIIPEVQR